MTKATCEPVRYFFGKDDSAHNYLVRADRRVDWNAWLATGQADWEPCPSIARRIDGVEAWTFTDPQAVQ
jgi:hypothetical protein